MKKFLVFSLFALLSTGTFSQSKELVSNAEEFASQSGSLVKSEFIFIGKVRNTVFEAVRYTDMLSGKTESALRFEYAVAIGMQTDLRESYLDADEADALLRSLRVIKTSVINKNPSVETQVTFTSRSGFQAGCLWMDGSWVPYVKGKKYDGDSFISLRNERNLDELIDVIERAKAKM
jgi:hypothetical protein